MLSRIAESGGVMDQDAIDIIGEPAVIAKIVEAAKSNGFACSQPMPTESISDALDAPFGVDEIRQVCEAVTLISGAGVSVVGFLATVKKLLSTVETDSGVEPAVEIKRTKNQRKIGRLTKHTDISKLRM
jgi:hypothetical protein